VAQSQTSVGARKNHSLIGGHQLKNVPPACSGKNNKITILAIWKKNPAPLLIKLGSYTFKETKVMAITIMLNPAVFVQLVLICVFGTAVTPSTNTRATIVDQAAETIQVKKVVDQFFSAAKKRDWDAVAEFMSTDFELYTDGASGFNKQAYVKVLKADDLQLVNIELRDMEIRVSSDGQMAWGKYRALFKGISHNQPSTAETAETLIFKRESEQWKITRAHVSLKPLNP
jgi:ketosteroid isomerase-like protein